MLNNTCLFPCGDVRNLSDNAMRLVTLYAFVFWVVCVYLVIKLYKAFKRSSMSRASMPSSDQPASGY